MGTIEQKIKSITKRQHFHLNHIIKKFSVDEYVFFSNKSSQIRKPKSVDDDIFIGISAWSHETETTISHPIEKKAIGQISRVLQGNNISDHSHLSDYHLLWNIRYFYAHNPCNSERIYNNFNFGEMDEDLKDFANYSGKMPINGDGSIDGIYVATQKIKQEFLSNREKYKHIKWRIYKSQSINFYSPDCYENHVMLPVSPNFLLVGEKTKHKPIILTPSQIDEFNNAAIHRCNQFYFGKPEV